MECYIYTIKCLTTHKCYVGQTQQYKYKNGKPYKYGITGRWCDHVSSAKSRNTPLCQAIREYGNDQFTIEILEVIHANSADEREQYWIQTLNCLVPNGYNVMSHSRCKHRQSSSILQSYLDSATAIELKIIKRDGSPKLVYLYITTPAEKKRITFGQQKTSSFEDAFAEATEWLEKFRKKGVHVIEKDSLFQDESFAKVRVVRFNKTMVAVYLKKHDKTQQRICFGGKTIPFDQALLNANEFISRLSYDVLETISKSATGDSHPG